MMRDDISRKKRETVSKALADSMVSMKSMMDGEQDALEERFPSDPLQISERAVAAGLDRDRAPEAYNAALQTLGASYGLMFRSPLFHAPADGAVVPVLPTVWIGDDLVERDPHTCIMAVFLAPAGTPAPTLGCPLADAGMRTAACSRDILRTSCTATIEAMMIIGEMGELMVDAIAMNMGLVR